MICCEFWPRCDPISKRAFSRAVCSSGTRTPAGAGTSGEAMGTPTQPPPRRAGPTDVSGPRKVLRQEDRRGVSIVCIDKKLNYCTAQDRGNYMNGGKCLGLRCSAPRNETHLFRAPGENTKKTKNIDRFGPPLVGLPCRLRAGSSGAEVVSFSSLVPRGAVGSMRPLAARYGTCVYGWGQRLS